MMIEILRKPLQFTALREEWNELLADSDGDGLFLSWEWMHCWWRHLAEERRLRLITVRRDGHLIALAPLARRGRRWRRLFPFPALEFLGAGEAGSDHLDVVVRRGYAAEALPALAEAVADTGLMLELSRLKDDAQAAALARVCGGRGWTAEHAAVDVCPYIDLTGLDWPGFLAGLGTAHRYNLRRRLRGLEKHWTVSFERAADEGQRAAALAELIALHQHRWRRRGEPGAFHSAALRAFHGELSRITLERGWLRLYRLKLDGRTVAAIYGFLYHGTFYFYQSGFDAEFQRHSVGLAIMALAIRSAIEEGAHTYDFLCGNEAYKSLWTERRRPLRRLMLYPPGRRGALYRRTMGLRGDLKKRVLRGWSPAGGNVPAADEISHV
jgi:CelD/BcsL family acetyltransferase involved in cellulose biosynthesis